MKNNKRTVNKMLTRGGIYLFYKELNYKSILINLKQTTKITNSNIRRFS